MEKNAAFMQAFREAPEGPMQKVAEATGVLIRTEIKERSFQRAILPYKPFTSGMRAYDDTENEMPYAIGEIESKAPAARVVSFYDGPDQVFYRGKKFRVQFNKIVTPEFVKQEDELGAYQNDLKQMIIEYALYQVENLEDARFIAAIDETVGSVGGVGMAGVAQNTESTGGITPQTYPLIKQHLAGRKLNNGKFLMNHVVTSLAFETWSRDEIGGDLRQDIFRNGLSALKSGTIAGVAHLFTQKQDLVPNGAVYMFTEEQYLGVAYELMPLTMYVEKKKDFVRTSAMEKVGFALANVAGVHKHTFRS